MASVNHAEAATDTVQRNGLSRLIDILRRRKDSPFDRDQRYQIRLGNKKKLDVALYAHPKFTWYQMEQIRRGLEQNLDVSTYAKPEYSAYTMQKIRLDQ